MTSRRTLGFFAAILASAAFAPGCGGGVEVSGETGGGSATSTGSGANGTGANGTGASAGTGGTGTGTGGTGGTTGGTGGATGGTGGTTTGTGGTGGSVACNAFDSEVACLGAYPSCVPVYDDKCCPSCDPVGGCADCTNIQFHHCTSKAASCGTNPTCGITPMWACTGGEPDCGIDPGGSSAPCHTVAGCTAAYCPVNTTCGPEPVCVAVTKGSCTTQCDSIPPNCPPGTTGESDGFCFTGLCIPVDVCAE